MLDYAHGVESTSCKADFRPVRLAEFFMPEFYSLAESGRIQDPYGESVQLTLHNLSILGHLKGFGRGKK